MLRVYSSKEVADIVGADPSSVNRWIDSGRLAAYRTPGGHRRVLARDLTAFLQQHGIDAPAELNKVRPGVLLAGDDPAVLRGFQRALQRADPGLDVQWYTSTTEALIQIGLRRPDVVVLDVESSGVDALTACHTVKSERALKHIAVVALIDRDNPRTTKRLIKAGAATVLVKPVGAIELVEQVKACTRPTNGEAHSS